MQPPFTGIKFLDALTLDDIIPLLDLELLFAARWSYRQGATAAEWEARRQNTVIPVFERMLALCRARDVVVPRVLYGYFRCRTQGSALVVEGGARPVRFDFPRERAAPNRCLADFFPEGFVSIALATVGAGATREGARLFSANAYSDAFLLKGLAAEAAEATAVFGHRHLQRELGAAENAGVRFSPGYPSFPSLFAQRKIAELLPLAKAGVTLTKNCQLVPEHSTTAFISFDPRAAHFRP